ncbi:MAG: hypothetical protein JO352_06375 [Chloroflexi bacterium]|nr:hypothetical protein [Chloroflexota bacterium]MBV9595591.1 hypothetical protein [Chloroflexota bacterium]
MALLARFACGCKLRVEIPAPEEVRCTEHGTRAVLLQMPNGQVRYTPTPSEAGQEEAPVVNRL